MSVALQPVYLEDVQRLVYLLSKVGKCRDLSEQVSAIEYDMVLPHQLRANN